MSRWFKSCKLLSKQDWKGSNFKHAFVIMDIYRPGLKLGDPWPVDGRVLTFDKRSCSMQCCPRGLRPNPMQCMIKLDFGSTHAILEKKNIHLVLIEKKDDLMPRMCLGKITCSKTICFEFVLYIYIITIPQSSTVLSYHIHVTMFVTYPCTKAFEDTQHLHKQIIKTNNPTTGS